MQEAPEPDGTPPGLIQRLGLNQPGRAMIAVGGALVLVVVLYMVLSGLQSDEPTVVLPSASFAAPSAQATQGERAQVPPVEACDLVTEAELEAAMGIANLDFVDRGMMSTSGRESCIWRNVRDAGPVEGLAVGIGPGTPDDFERGASLEGKPGRTADGAGDAAVWFGGDDVGTISVATTNSYGYVFLRVSLQRSDTDDAGRQEAAAALADAAIHRLPGAEVEPLQEVDITPEPPDRTDDSLVENLLSREQAGDWTRGEGLVATLGLMTGDTNAREVLVHPLQQPDVQEANGLIEMAQEYLLDGEDPSAQEEIAALLGHVIFSNEALEAMAGIGGETAGIGGEAGGITLAAARPTASPDVILAQGNPCEDFFYGYNFKPAASGNCLEWDSFSLGPGLQDKYRIFYPAADAPQAGWSEDDYKLARQAIKDAVPKYEPWGIMPRVNVVFTVVPGDNEAAATADPGGGQPCSIAIYTSAQHLPEELGDQDSMFKQVLAHELAHCFTTQRSTPQSRVHWNTRKWWYEGIAEYLSNVVYSSVNFEWRMRQSLARIELGTSLVERDYENFAFFQHLANETSTIEVLNLIDRMPGCGTASDELSRDDQTQCWKEHGVDEQARKLTTFPNIADLYQSSTELLTDARIQDTGGGRIPFKPQTIPITEKGSYNLELSAFDSIRLDFQVPDGLTACLSHNPSDDVIVSWRDGTADGDGLPRLYYRNLPDTLSREAVFVATAIREGAYAFEIKDFVERESDCDPDQTPTNSCDFSICGYSDFYWLEKNMDQFVRDLLPPLSPPTEITN